MISYGPNVRSRKRDFLGGKKRSNKSFSEQLLVFNKDNIVICTHGGLQ